MKLTLMIFLFSFSAFSQEVFRFAIGSCNKQFHQQPLWDVISTYEPDIFVWAGDSVYANTDQPSQIESSFQQQLEVPGYKKFIQKFPVIGTWDDHDYNDNNANGHYEHKELSQKYFLDFLKEPETSPRRKQQGVYTTQSYNSGGKKITYLLLDNRYFKDLDEEAPLLGKAQWAWLEEQLKTQEADLYFIVTGMPVNSPRFPGSDEWADYPQERERLIELTTQTKKPFFFLTGDKHFSSLYKNNGYYDFMSSGMTHTTRLPLRFIVKRFYPNYYFGHTFGLVDVRFEDEKPVLFFKIINSVNDLIYSQTLRWNGVEWL